MRKILLILMVAFASGMRANTITVTGGSGHPGDEVTVSVTMDGTEAVTALEMQLPLPSEWLAFVDGSCSLATGRSDGHSVTAKSVDGVLKVYAYNLSLKPFKGTSGELLSFRLRLGDVPGDLPLLPTVMASDATGATIATSATGGTATILCPALRIVTEQTDFGHVPIRSSYTRQLTLQNYGNEPLTISSITPDNQELSVSPTTLTIPAGSSASATVTYSPLKRMPFDATLTIESDAVNAKIYNKWQTAKVVADPYSVNELHVAGASGASDTEVEIAIRMNNMEPIVGAQVSFLLPDALRYVEGSAAMTERGDGHTVLANMEEGNRLSIFVYSSNNRPLKNDDGDFCTFRLSLEGQSGYYTLSPQNVILSNAAMENMTSATSGASVRIQSPTISGSSSLAFGQQDATKPLTATYNLHNSGQAMLTVEKATFLADGYRVITPLPLDIETNRSAILEIEYTATQAGDFATTMNLYCNDPATRVKTVAVSGRAFSPNELTISGEYEDSGYRVSIGLSNDAPLTAVQFSLTPSRPLKEGEDVTITPSTRLASHNANIYPMGDGTWKVLVFSMANATIAGCEGEICSVWFPAVSLMEDMTFSLGEVVLSSTDSRNMLSPAPTLPQSYTFPAVVIGSGDTNGDGEVNITDVVNLVDYINNGERPGMMFYLQYADANGDGTINITDVVKIIETINNQ